MFKDFFATLISISEENISTTAAKDAQKDAVIIDLVAKINDLTTAVAQLSAESKLQHKERVDIKNGAISTLSASRKGAGNAADYRAITQFIRNETAYWGRSIKVSNERGGKSSKNIEKYIV